MVANCKTIRQSKVERQTAAAEGRLLIKLREDTCSWSGDALTKRCGAPKYIRYIQKSPEPVNSLAQAVLGDRVASTGVRDYGNSEYAQEGQCWGRKGLTE